MKKNKQRRYSHKYEEAPNGNPKKRKIEREVGEMLDRELREAKYLKEINTKKL
jgi:hypothetical protein